LRILEECTYPDVVMRDVRQELGLNDGRSSYNWLPDCEGHERMERSVVNGRRAQRLTEGSGGFLRRGRL
jgi:hypothetical protein